jgi:XTP/dITP diphosphohydrolase/tetrapyrrole methylase family protein/MazG family protein
MSAIDDLKQTMARLRAKEGGCPWDQEQTHQSLARCLIDECSELLETIDRLDMPHMREELGDVLIQIVFHARIAEEAGLFNFDDVAREINEKLIRRHPHVFGENKVATTDQVLTQWELIKLEEKKNKGIVSKASVFKELPPRLPALMFSEAVWKQIKKKNLPYDGIIDKVSIDQHGVNLSDELLGKMLFELTSAAQDKGLDPEGSLRRYADQIAQTIETRVNTKTN